jgi:hypothetical protein
MSRECLLLVGLEVRNQVPCVCRNLVLRRDGTQDWNSRNFKIHVGTVDSCPVRDEVSAFDGSPVRVRRDDDTTSLNYPAVSFPALLGHCRTKWTLMDANCGSPVLDTRTFSVGCAQAAELFFWECSVTSPWL